MDTDLCDIDLTSPQIDCVKGYGNSIKDKINSIIKSKSCKIDDAIKFIGKNKIKLTKESGLGKYSKKYADEIRNVWEIYAREAHFDYKTKKKDYNSKYLYLKKLKMMYGYTDAVVSLFQGLLPAITVTGLISLLSSNSKNKTVTWTSIVQFLITTILPTYFIFLYTFLKWIKGRTMKHSPLIPFLTGSFISVVIIYSYSIKKLELKNINLEIRILLGVFTVILILLTIFTYFYYK